MSKTEFSLEALDVSKLPELSGFEQKQKDLVTENPYIEIVDNKTYEDACKRRTALLKGRTALEAQDKLIASKLTSFRKQVAEKTKTLIDITLPHEEKQQTEVKRYEAEKQAEKDAKQKEEDLRIEKIKTSIDKIETDCLEVIQTMTFETIEKDSTSVNEILATELDFEEYDVMFDQVKSRVEKSLSDRVSGLTQREEQRLENERMKKEIFDTRVNRLKEVGYQLNDNFFISDWSDLKMGRLYIFDLDSESFEKILSEIKLTIEQSEQSKRDAELKKQKDEQFEVRKNRLAEIGFSHNSFTDFICDIYDTPTIHVEDVDSELVYNASITEFEEILTNAKNSIQQAKEHKSIQDKKDSDNKRISMFEDFGTPLGDGFEMLTIGQGDKDAFRLTKEDVFDSSDEHFSIMFENYKKAYNFNKELVEKEAKKKADAENKARVKRLAKDKATYEMVLKESLLRFPAIFEAENIEIRQFSIDSHEKFKSLVSDLLTQLNDL